LRERERERTLLERKQTKNPLYTLLNSFHVCVTAPALGHLKLLPEQIFIKEQEQKRKYTHTVASSLTLLFHSSFKKNHKITKKYIKAPSSLIIVFHSSSSTTNTTTTSSFSASYASSSSLLSFHAELWPPSPSPCPPSPSFVPSLTTQ
jgi:hypothetical protein